MAKKSVSCPVCEKKAKKKPATTGDYSEFECSRCGPFRISRTLLETISDHPKSVRRLALDRARVRAMYGALPSVTTYDLP